MTVTEWHKYKDVSLSDTTPIDYPDPLELLLRDPRPSPAAPPEQANFGERSRSRIFIPDAEPTTRDRDLGLIVCLALFCATPILFVYAIIKLFE